MTGFELCGGSPPNQRSEQVRYVTGRVMAALCGDAPEAVPLEYTHLKHTAVGFMAEFLADCGIPVAIIDEGVRNAHERYKKAA